MRPPGRQLEWLLPWLILASAAFVVVVVLQLLEVTPW